MGQVDILPIWIWSIGIRIQVFEGNDERQICSQLPILCEQTLKESQLVHSQGQSSLLQKIISEKYSLPHQIIRIRYSQLKIVRYSFS